MDTPYIRPNAKISNLYIMHEIKLNIAYISFLISGLWLFGAVAQAQPQANYTTPYSFTTFIGANSAGYVDGVGSQARFSGPRSIVVNNVGNLFVGDTANSLIRQVTPEGKVSTYLGDPEIKYKIGETLSPLNGFGLFTLDARGNFYVFHSYSIFKITPNGTVTKIAGGNYYGNTDGTGSEARFDAVDSMVSDANGNLYVTANHAIRKVSPEGTVTTLAGKSGESGSADGLGSESRFSILGGITIDTAGNLFVVDRGNHTIRKVTPNGIVSTLAGSVTASNFGGTADGTGVAAQFYLPQGITIDALAGC